MKSGKGDGGNDEIRMTNDKGMSKYETRKQKGGVAIVSVIRASCLFRHSTFVLRHFI